MVNPRFEARMAAARSLLGAWRAFAALVDDDDMTDDEFDRAISQIEYLFDVSAQWAQLLREH
jgi:hypothetical protein